MTKPLCSGYFIADIMSSSRLTFPHRSNLPIADTPKKERFLYISFQTVFYIFFKFLFYFVYFIFEPVNGLFRVIKINIS